MFLLLPCAARAQVVLLYLWGEVQGPSVNANQV